MERLSHNHTDDTSELLSAYSDDALDVLDRRRAETQVQSCAACAQELRDLRMFKTLLREIPAIQPRRSFTLDPATAVGPRRLLFPMLRLATVAASLLFFVVLGVDLLNVGGIGAQDVATFSTKEVPAARQLEFDTGTGAGSAEMAEAYGAASAAPSFEALTAPLSPEPAAAEADASAVPEAMADATLPSTETAVAAANAASPPADAPVEPPAAAESQSADQPVDGQDTAGGTQPLQANEPSSPDTAEIQRMDVEEAQGTAFSTLRFAEIGLALIALAFAGGALWAWRQQR